MVVGVSLVLTSFLGWFEDRVDFNTQVKPLLNKNCIACHGGVKKAGGFSVLFRHEAVAPTKSGKPAIVPGDADASEMIRRLTLADHDERMPLEAPPLKSEEIDILRKWIGQGAKWAYIWIEKPEIPSVGSFWSRLGLPFLAKDEETSWVKNEIDPFVLERLRAQSLTPKPTEQR